MKKKKEIFLVATSNLSRRITKQFSAFYDFLSDFGN